MCQRRLSCGGDYGVFGGFNVAGEWLSWRVDVAGAVARQPPTRKPSQRIVAAAVHLLAETGSEISISDVAASLGVIRQTVYRYFPTAEALMRAAAIASVDDFSTTSPRPCAGSTTLPTR